ncbi:ATP-binding protein [Luteitalea sp. TBR-22]|uniref:ATP-binding protein n=1 Tax=Luteitalea sp. TBR-22 TaxID=2802971 RepID=UPI001EF6FFA2|nr:ATP-binding protein [Luteitalea sp. TBR-22]
MRRPVAGPARYALAAALTLALGTAQVALTPLIGPRFPFLLFYGAVILSSLAGGLSAGLLSLAISLLFVSYALLEPVRRWAIDDPATLVALGIFATIGVLTAVGAERLQRARREAEDARMALEAEVRERTAARDALAASEARFRAAQDASLQPFTVLEAVRDQAGAIVDFRWLYANAAAERALHASLTELTGRRLLDVVPGNRDTLFPLYCSVVTTRQPHDTTLHYRADGIDGWYRNIAVPLGDGVAVAFLDITAEKQLEAELASRDAYKDHFLAVLAHELRQPLQAITVAARALRDPAADRGHVARIVDRQVAQLSRLISDLNDLTRIKQGRLQFETGPCDLCDVITGAVDGHREWLAEHGVRLEVKVPEAPLEVSADAARLQQALANLLHNAARATPPGGTVSIAATRDGDDAVVRVVDTGTGIDLELLPQIFSLFLQDDRAGAARLGVGLALVHSIVLRHGGAVHVHSDGPGTGAAFEIRLPMATQLASR